MTTPPAPRQPQPLALTILGSRGSIPVSGPEFCRYGGNTTAMAISAGDEVFGFVDAGTALNAYLAYGLTLADSVRIFLTHYHWDHIQGLSMLRGIWNERHTFDVCGPGPAEDILVGAIGPPWFPVSLSDQPNVTFGGVDEAETLRGVSIAAFPINHPQGAIGFRLDGPSASVVIITDHETSADTTPDLVSIAEGVHTVIHDAQYLPDEAVSHRGWGHSSWEDAVTFAETVGASRLILTSHDPGRTDDEIDAIVDAARRRFPNTDAATPGMRVGL